MARHKAEIIEDMVDESPDGSAPVAVLEAPELIRQDEAPPRRPIAPKKKADDAFPWGFLIKHPSYGALRIRRDEAKTEAEAIEVYRQRKCPHMKLAALENGGIRIGVLAFRPAETERGK